MTDYAFPVALEKLYLQTGVEVPRIRSIVRQDTGDIVATVSDKYRLVKHETVMTAAESFINLFGQPERKYHLNRSGARLVGEFTYRDKRHLRTVQKGDIVGLKVFVENSYNTESAVRVQIGALVLSCLNGMVVPKSIYSYTCHHVFGKEELEFPSTDTVIEMYKSQTGVWKDYAERDLKSDGLSYTSILTTALAMDVITHGGRDRLADKPADTYWDLMQNMTFEATHRGQISPIGRLARLERMDRFVRGIASSRQLPVVETAPIQV